MSREFSDDTIHTAASQRDLPMDVSSPVSVTSMPHATPQGEHDAFLQKSASLVPYLLLSAVDSADRNPTSSSDAGVPLPPPLPLTAGTNHSRQYPTRTRSLPQRTLSSSRPDSRRKIFTDYWDRAESEPPPDVDLLTSTEPGYKGIVGNSTSSRQSKTHPSTEDIRFYSPAPNYRCTLKKHHELLENVVNQSGQIPSSRTLPSLPEPLRRLVDESKSSKSCGMYPLLSPKSILRKSRNYCRLDGDDDEAGTTPHLRSDRGLNHNMKDPVLISTNNLRDAVMDVGDEEGNEFYRKARLHHSATNAEKRVHFDPRIVITEFDDGVKRQWYTEAELQTLRNETITLAQYYCLLHPQIAAACNDGKLDPVTGKPKRKVLFSLPILNCLPEDFNPYLFSKQLGGMLCHGVKHILVVDPNPVILQLYCKSIANMFPGAKIVAVESAEQALRKYKMALKRQAGKRNCRSFDIVVVEEKLSRPPLKIGPHERSHSFQQDCRESKMKRCYQKQSSLPSLEMLTHDENATSGRMSGSQLIMKIREFEEQLHGGKNAGNENNRGVIIGVSTNLERDQDALQKSGADLTWSKPPPPMGIQLRNQLLCALVSKRKGPCES